MDVTLDDRMRKYEHDNERIIAPTTNFIIRLDGNGFSKCTKGLHKPFDDNFVLAMANVLSELLIKFNPSTGYTHSDEITLIFSAISGNKTEHIFGGRQQKILSEIASYTAVRFNYHISRIIDIHESQYTDDVIKLFNDGLQNFDARIIIHPEDKQNEIVNHMIWRSVHDCHRNAVETYARQYYSHTQLHKKNSKEMIEMMLVHGLNWDDVPQYLKHGIYAKRETYEMECVDGKTGENTKCTRSRVVFKTFKIYYSEKILEMLLGKYWTGYEEYIPDAKNLKFDIY